MALNGMRRHLATHEGGARPPHSEAVAVVAELVTDLVEAALWAAPQPVCIGSSTHKKVEGITRNAESLPHAMAVVRAMHGRQDLDRQKLRRLASSFYRRPFFRCDELPEKQQQYVRNVLCPKGLLRRRLHQLFLEHRKPPFVQQLLRKRPFDEFGRRAAVHSPNECGMERAYTQMQRMRAQRGLRPLRWVDDERNPSRRDHPKTPKGKAAGERLPEYLEWYAEQVEQPYNFMTLYDLEAMVLMLPERPSLILYTPSSRAGGRMTAMTFGPPPQRGVPPYELVWSGDDSVQFAPIVLMKDLRWATRLAERLAPRQRCLTGPDLFRSGMLRSHVSHAESALRDAGLAPTAERLAKELGVVAEVAAAMLLQIEREDFGRYDLDSEQRQLAGQRKRKRERTAFGAVGLKLRCIVNGRRTALRHRVERRDGRDEASMDAPFERTGRTMVDFARQMDVLGARLQRPPLVEEVAAEIGEGVDTARALFLAFMEENPYTGFEYV